MADPDRNRRVRHTHTRTTKNLSYGHFGTASYEDSSHRWHFLRQIHGHHQDDSTRTGLCPFQLVHEQIRQLGMDDLEPKNAIRHVPTWPLARRTLLNRVPEGVGAAHYLPTPSQVETLEELCISQTRGEIISFGHARSTGDRSLHSHLVPIVAFPTGTGGEVVRFLAIDIGGFVLNDESSTRSTWQVPCISSSTIGHWCQSADRILQISCCTSNNRTQLLIRKSGGTSILRPLIRARTPSSAEAQPSTSAIDPNHVLTIPCSRTGGHHHADALFNPLDPDLLAITDVSGQWSVWKMKGKEPKSTRVTLRVQLLQQGSLFNTDPQPFAFNRNINLDGWHRVCWLSSSMSSSGNILVCSRVSATIFNNQGTFLDHVDMRLGPPSDGVCILDVKQGVRHQQLIYVLSTSRLQIFTTSQLDLELGSETEPLNLVCAWNHFRDEHDLDLRMTVVEHSQSTCIFLYSPLSTIGTVFQFQHDQSGTRIELSWEPTTLQWPKGFCERMKSITNLVIVPVDSRVNNCPPDKLGWSIVMLLAWTSRGELVEAFYRHKLGNVSTTRKESDGLSLLRFPDPIKQLYLSNRFVDEDDLDNFVVEEETDRDREQAISNDLASAFHKDAQAVSHSAENRSWDHLLDHGTLQSNEENRPSVIESLDQVSERIGRLWNDLLPISTLSYLFKGPRILDLEAASQSVDGWLRSLQGADHVSIQPTTSHLESLLNEFGKTSLLTFYEAYLVMYINPLAPNVTDRIRVNREKIVRQTAADAFFGGIALRSNNEAAETEDIMQSSTPQEDLSRVQLQSSQRLMATIPPLVKEPIVSRLRSYTTFRREGPPLLLTSTSAISNILDHLPNTIIDDPTTYSYEATNKKIQNAQDEEAELLLDPRERRQVRRQAAKHLRDLEKLAKFTQDVQSQRSKLPGVTNHTFGPTLPGREIRSSQPAVPESSQGQGQGASELNMTQPERGAYGTRPQKKKKSKEKVVKRKAGF